MRDSGAFLFVSPSGAKLPRAARQCRGNKQHSVSTDPLRPAARLTTFTPAPANRKKKKSKLVQPMKGVSRIHLRFHHRPWDPAGPANQRGPIKNPASSAPAQRSRPTMHCRNVFDSRTGLVSNPLWVKTNPNKLQPYILFVWDKGGGGGAVGCEPMRRRFVAMCD